MQRLARLDLVAQSLRRNNRYRLILRVVAVAGLIVVCVIVDEVGPRRFQLAAALVGVIAGTLLVHRLVPARRRPAIHAWLDVLATAGLIWMVPDVWAAGLVIVAASPAASASMTGRRHYLAIESVGLALLAVAAHLSGAESWVVPWMVAILLMPLISGYVDVFLAQERTANAHLTNLLEMSSVLCWDVDADTGELLSADGRTSEILGWEPDEIVDRDVTTIIHPDDRRMAAKAVDLAPDASTIYQARFRHKDGHYVWLRHSIRMLREPGRRILRGIAIDVSELVHAHEETRRRAQHDELTGLVNRARFLELVQASLEEGRRAALLLLDLDRFKQVNDTLGHQAGDTYLTMLATQFQACAVPGDFVARLGGDEFAVLAQMPRGIDEIFDLARRLAAAAEATVDLEGVEFAGSASIGIVLSPLHGSDPMTLLRRADVAMYRAKRAGLPHHLFDFGTDEVTVERLALTSEVESAIAVGDLRLWFQPKVDLASNEIVGAEGLLRWHHPRRGVLAPAEFLDVTELSRHMPALTQSVVAQGIEMIRATSLLGHPIQVSVNISIRNLLETDFTESIARLISTAGIEPSLLILEVTEREIMDDRGGHRIDTDALRSLGIGFAVDDFGTGHSSLVRIQQLPVTELKIDRQFVAAMASDSHAPILVRSIVDLAKNLGHTIVAEGVESLADAVRLREMGCDLAQGYLYSPAVPAAELLAMLTSGVSGPLLVESGR